MDETQKALLWAILAAVLTVSPLLAAAALLPAPPTVQMTVDEFNRRW